VIQHRGAIIPANATPSLEQLMLHHNHADAAL
jgi:hypothetical protein